MQTCAPLHTWRQQLKLSHSHTVLWWRAYLPTCRQTEQHALCWWCYGSTLHNRAACPPCLEHCTALCHTGPLACSGSGVCGARLRRCLAQCTARLLKSSSSPIRQLDWNPIIRVAAQGHAIGCGFDFDQGEACAQRWPAYASSISLVASLAGVLWAACDCLHPALSGTAVVLSACLHRGPCALSGGARVVAQLGDRS